MKALSPSDSETWISLELVDVAHFNYEMLAELFVGTGQRAKYRTMTYRRLAKGADVRTPSLLRGDQRAP